MEYLTELKAFGLSYKPDVILLNYYAGNDLTNVGYKMDWDQGWRGRLRPYVRRAYLYHWIHDLQNRIAARTFNFESFKEKGIDPEVVELAKKRQLNFYFLSLAKAHPEYLTDNLLVDGTSNGLAWRKVKRILTQIKTLSDTIRAKLVIVIFPESLQVGSSHSEYYRKFGFHVPREVLGSSRPQTLMMEFCKEMNLSCLDLLPYFRRHSGDLYQEYDPHLNSEGNELSAHWIANFLAAQAQS